MSSTAQTYSCHPDPLRAGGTSKYFRRNSNQFPSIASKKFAEICGSEGPSTSPPEGVFRHKRRMELVELSGRITGRLGYDYRICHRRYGKAGTTILYHLHIYRRQHSSSGMTAGRRKLLGMGTAATSAGAAGPSEGLRAGRSSGRTKPEYTAPSGRHHHATTGAGRRVSPTTGTRSQTTCYTRRGTGRV